MKILLVGNGHRQNRGCEAITLTTIKLLRETFPGVKIEILSPNPDIDRYHEAPGVIVSEIKKDVVPEKPFILRILNRLHLQSKENQAIYDELEPYVKKLAACDLVVSVGGDNYSEDYGVPYFYWKLAFWAQKYGKPFVIWGASVGPFSKGTSLDLAQQGLACASLVTAREDVTVNYLKSINAKCKVVRVFDSAFLLEKKDVTFPEFPRKAETVGFNISPIHHRYCPDKDIDQVFEIARKFVLEISETYNVLLIPHVVWNEVHNNDAIYMEPIAKESNNIIMADPDYDSMQCKSLISRCNYFIGSRTHATIAAFSSAVPTLSLGYSIKAKGLNEELFGTDEFLLKAKEFGLESLHKKFQHLVEHREKARLSLEEKQTLFADKVKAGVKEVRKFVKNA